MSNPMTAGEFLDFLDGDAWVAAVERRKSGAAIAVFGVGENYQKPRSEPRESQTIK